MGRSQGKQQLIAPYPCRIVTLHQNKFTAVLDYFGSGVTGVETVSAGVATVAAGSKDAGVVSTGAVATGLSIESALGAFATESLT